jgi:hypothetical protein
MHTILKGQFMENGSKGTNINLKEHLWEKTRATDTEKRHNILEKGRFLLADYCEIGVC